MNIVRTNLVITDNDNPIINKKFRVEERRGENNTKIFYVNSTIEYMRYSKEFLTSYFKKINS